MNKQNQKTEFDEYMAKGVAIEKTGKSKTDQLDKKTARQSIMGNLVIAQLLQDPKRKTTLGVKEVRLKDMEKIYDEAEEDIMSKNGDLLDKIGEMQDMENDTVNGIQEQAEQATAYKKAKAKEIDDTIEFAETIEKKLQEKQEEGS